jgi:nucleoid DNA-binding protein
LKKLKTTSQRKPEDSITFLEMTRDIAKETGYVQDDIEVVLLAYLEKIKLHLLDRKRVRLRGIGELYPIVVPPKKVTNMGGSNNHDYGKMETEAKWKLTFKVVESMEAEVSDILVTKKDLSKIYKD